MLRRDTAIFVSIFSFVVVVFDTVFKSIAINRLPPAGSRSDFGFIGLGLHKNPGISFDIPFPYPLLFLITVIFVGILGYLAVTWWRSNPILTAGAVTTILGALGNLIDRAVHGFTTDYILFATGSAINLADILIIFGVLTILFQQARVDKT